MLDSTVSASNERTSAELEVASHLCRRARAKDMLDAVALGDIEADELVAAGQVARGTGRTGVGRQVLLEAGAALDGRAAEQ